MTFDLSDFLGFVNIFCQKLKNLDFENKESGESHHQREIHVHSGLCMTTFLCVCSRGLCLL